MTMDMSKRLEKLVFVEVVPDLSSLSATERKALTHCIEAADLMTSIYLRQISLDNPRWYEELKAREDTEGRNLFRHFEINGGPWDLFDDDQPFLPGIGPKPKGIALYPPDLTEKEWHDWLEEHPDDREQFESNRTLIVRNGNSLAAIPYSIVYRDLLEQAASELKAAADYLPDGKLKTYLKLQAQAFTSNNYWDCDLAWIDTDGRPFEVTIGPHEVYADRLFGLKATFEAFLGLPDEHSSAQLRSFSTSVPDFDSILADRFGYRPKGPTISLEVVSDIYRGGEATFGRQFVAYNLPNDRRIHQLKGSKRVFSRTMMEAKFLRIAHPISERILKAQEIRTHKFDNWLLSVLAHELAHGLGPSLVRLGSREVAFETLLRDLHSQLEEAKADVLGVALLHYFAQRGLLEWDDFIGCLVTQIVHFFQDWRTNYTDAHSAGALIQYNWLKEHKAVSYDRVKKALNLEPEKILVGMEKLCEEFLRIQTDGIYSKAKAFVQEWGRIPAEVPEIVKELSGIPYEVYPVYRFSSNGEEGRHTETVKSTGLIGMPRFLR